MESGSYAPEMLSYRFTVARQSRCPADSAQFVSFEPTPGRQRLRAVGLLAVGIAVAALVVWRDSDLRMFGATFASVKWGWIVAAVLLNLVSAGAGSLAWRTVIGEAIPRPCPRYRDVLSAYSVGLLGNALLPGRAGELARVAVLARRLDGRGVWATLLGSVFAFRLLDLLPSLALAGYVVIAVPLPHWALSSLAFVAIVGAGLFLLGVSAARRQGRQRLGGAGRIRRLVASGRKGLGVLHAPLPAATAALHQCVAWSAQLLAVWTALRAFHIILPVSGAALVLVLVNVAILFPLWPGNVGLLQAAIAIPLTGYGVDYAQGLAFGIGLQAIETTVGVTLGLVFLAREGLSLAALARMPAASAVEAP